MHRQGIVKDRKFLIIYPSDKFRSYWDVIQSILLLVTCFVVPINLAFSSETDSVVWYTYSNYLIDFIFMLDMLVVFNTAVKTDFEIIDNRRTIAYLYFRTWFLLDFLAIFPIDTFLSFVNESPSGSAADKANTIVRLSRFQKI